jgi:hypothetical protein
MSWNIAFILRARGPVQLNEFMLPVSDVRYDFDDDDDDDDNNSDDKNKDKRYFTRRF